MKIKQYIFTEVGVDSPVQIDESVQIVFLFGSREMLLKKEYIKQIKEAFPKGILFGCTTAGEIYQTSVYDHSLTVTAVHFEKTEIRTVNTILKKTGDSYQAGKTLVDALEKNNLKHVLVLSDGILVNGSELTKGLVENLPNSVAVTGGLSGDAARFEKTFVMIGDEPLEGAISVIGLYGDQINIGYASLGGWDTFGPERIITKSKENILYELDGEPVLNLYKKYLGDYAKDLPGAALRFPLNLRIDDSNSGVVRTILGMNEADGSLTFAGDMPEGAYANLMKANFDRLIDGAIGAATATQSVNQNDKPELALLISCVGRKLVLDQRIEEEVEAVREVYGDKTIFAGFYSYGEISPFTPNAKCELHNQTMTITTFSEK